jgi:LemA protein
MEIYIGIFIIVVLFIYIFGMYNSLVKSKNRVDEAFSTMDVYLKKRWDLIPNLVEAVKGYADYEKTTLKEITELRSNVYDTISNNDKVDINSKLEPNIIRLIALSEAYPNLKANENYKDLCDKLKEIENDIANARKYYNGTVRIMNNKVQMFPSNIVARIFGFKTCKMYEINNSERGNVKVEV